MLNFLVIILLDSDALTVADRETGHSGQDKLIQSDEESNLLFECDYKRFEDKVTAAGGDRRIDQVLCENNVDVVFRPAHSRLPDVTAVACRYLDVGISNRIDRRLHIGYPALTLPLGYPDWNGRPFGILAIASRFGEELLLDVARLWKAIFPRGRVPHHWNVIESEICCTGPGKYID